MRSEMGSEKRLSLSAPRRHPTSVWQSYPVCIMIQQSRRGVYPPRGEPEIIPPGADWPPTPRSRVSNSAAKVTLVRVARLGPVGIVVALLVLGMLAALTVVLLLGLAVVGVATTGVVIIGAAISLFLRGRFPR